MSCLTTSATRRSRSVPAAALIASAAASSHDVPLVPMISVTLYTLMSLSFDDWRPGPGLLRPACHRARWQFVDGGKCSRAWVVGFLWPDGQHHGDELGPIAQRPIADHVRDRGQQPWRGDRA